MIFEKKKKRDLLSLNTSALNFCRNLIESKLFVSLSVYIGT